MSAYACLIAWSPRGSRQCSSTWGSQPATARRPYYPSLSTTRLDLHFTMAFDPTFGSVGDFIAVISLISNAYSALSESAGSPFEYRCLVEDLNAFKGLEERLNSHIDALEPNEAARLRRRIATSTTKMLAHEKRISKYKILGTTSSTPQNIREKLSRSLRKISWKIFHSKDVKLIKEDLTLFWSSFSAELQIA